MVSVALNLGCGNDYRISDNDIRWVNADKGNCKVDSIVNIENTPYIFEADLFDRIDAIQVLEHVHKEVFFDVIRELYRISKCNSIWNITVPHGFSDNFITDPTHFMPYSERTFDFFIDGSQLRENGIIYGVEDIRLEHENKPFIDSNMSIVFKLKVIK